MLNRLREHRYVAELPFKAVYFIFAVFTYCNVTFMQPVMSVAVDAVLVFGSLALLGRALFIRGYLKQPGLLLVTAFFLSFLISFLLNTAYGVMDNLKGAVWMAFHFFALFACDARRPAAAYRREFTLLSAGYLAVFFALSVASLVQYFIGYSREAYYEEYTLLAGVVWGRLWGVYRDPNYASVFATLAIMLSVYYLRTLKRWWVRGLLVIGIVVQALYITLSGSRTGLVAVFLCALLYAFMLFFKRISLKPIAKIAASVGVAIVVGVIGVVFVTAVGKANEALVQYYGDEALTDTADDDLRDFEGDISNRRFDLWGSGLEIFGERPLFGVSFYNLQAFAKENLPQTYLVNNDHGLFNNMHNMIFNVIPAQGLLGIAVFAAFAGWVIWYIFRNIFNAPDGDFEYLTVLLVCVVGGLVSSMFLTDIVYVNSPTSLIFWLFLGYLCHYIKQQKQAAVAEEAQ